MSTVINQLKQIQTVKEALEVVSHQEPQVQHILVENAIESLNFDIEMYISEGLTKAALWELSRVVVLEDALNIVDRMVLKRAVLAQ